MSNFQNDPVGLNDFHLGQENHYFPNKAVDMKGTLRSTGGTAPTPPPKDNKYSPGAATAAQTAAARLGTQRPNQHSAFPTIKPHRKPVAPANLPATQAPQQFKRKPVGDKPIALTIPPTQPVQQLQQQQRVQSPNGEIRTIYRDAEGKIDPSTIKHVPASRFTPPVSPLRPTHERAVHERPTSRGSFLSFGRNKRANTNDSSNSRPSGSRRGSVTELFKAAGRRLSDAFKVDIVKMNPDERDDWISVRQEEKKRAASKRSIEAEEQRRMQPKSRPSFQKDAIVQKNKQDTGLAHDFGMTEENYDAMLEQSKLNALINRAHRKSHQEECKRAAAEGRPRPKSPADLPVADLTLDPAERGIARQNTSDKHIDELGREGRVSPPHFTAGEKVALSVSKATDGFKRPRSNTVDSDMSMSMTDVAPPEMMLACVRCQRPPETFLHSSGVCRTCFIYEREQKAKNAKIAMTGKF